MKNQAKRPLDVLLRAIANPIIALVLAFLLSGLVVLISGDDPMEDYAAILQGAFGSKSNLINTVRYMLPILMLALSFTLCDSCGYFNIGQEGQMYSAVVTMAWIQHAFGGAPQWLLSILLVLGAIVAAGIVSLLPALLKNTLGINEVVVGILLNNIMLCLSDYMIRYTAIAEINKSVAMSIQIVPTFSRMSLLIASVVIMVAYTLIMRNTVPGYRLRMVGSNPTFSKSNGLHVIRIVLIVSFIGGAFSGLAAAGETMGIYHRMHSAYADGMGFSGMTAALIGKESPLGMVLGSLLLGALQSGSVNLTVSTSVQAEIVNVIKGFVMLFATVNLLQYFRGAKKEAAK